MIKFIFKRLLGLVPLLWGITFVSFLVIHLAPGDPVGAQSQMDLRMSMQAREQLTQLYGLDQPLLVQYAHWCRRVVTFDFGNSFVDGEPVTRKIAEAIPITLTVSLLSLMLIFLVGIPWGVFGAVQGRTLWGRGFAGLAFFFISTPTFWISLILLSWLGCHLRWVPISGLHSLFYEDMTPLRRWLDALWHLALPVCVLAIGQAAGLSRYIQSGLTEVLKQNYIRTARAKGLPESQVLYRHALKNALLPVLTILGLSIPGLLGGSVVIESIFSIPGMGRLFFNAVFARDYPVLMGLLTLGAFLTLLGNSLADAAYAWADPRIRHESL